MSPGLLILLVLQTGEAPPHAPAVRPLRLQPATKLPSCQPLLQGAAFSSAGRSQFRSIGFYWADEYDVGPKEAKNPLFVHLSIETDRGLFQTGLPLPVPLREDGLLKTSFRDRTLAAAFCFAGVGRGGLLCRLGTGGKPICTEPTLVEGIENDCEAVPLQLVPTPDGDFLVNGRSVNWNAATARPLAGPRREHHQDVWGHPVDEDIRFFPGIDAAGFVAVDQTGQKLLQVQTSAGCFMARDVPSRLIKGWVVFTAQAVGEVMLLKWSEGPGVIDPPDSDYQARVQVFVACLVGGGGVPLCSAPVVVARRRRGDEESWLSDEVSDASRLADRTFELQGTRFHVVAPARD